MARRSCSPCPRVHCICHMSPRWARAHRLTALSVQNDILLKYDVCGGTGHFLGLSSGSVMESGVAKMPWRYVTPPRGLDPKRIPERAPVYWVSQGTPIYSRSCRHLPPT
ncbi:unnamed protein product [Pylaiella littoralis]